MRIQNHHSAATNAGTTPRKNSAIARTGAERPSRPTTQSSDEQREQQHQHQPQQQHQPTS